ncbi:molybdate ABC transporter substrate-binding protein [Thermoanaerobacterium sp. RBIITD]|uniref:molybdate ABC transporter substrate-binding protein n=1 Tax=Thermoanaerobacterium sp. RBIITD TaxID=1550240 RepID=UPI000BB977B7|nr:molybdate ABC transporter substrate-binding protein [Thermoanaerobacterium sp. RBIITD]SNX53743.1 molybdate transport system substrate-binding protein [Thermoanaerobacterium sp. RBIITD]
MRYLKIMWLIIALFSIIIMLTGCNTNVGGNDNKSLTVFIAASLKDSMNTIVKQFEKLNPGVKIILNPAGSQTLRTQIEQGAYADIFVSADERNMKPLQDKGLVEAPKILLYNKLIVIAYKDSNISNFMDIKNTGLKLALADESVPAGKYAFDILSKIDADNKGFKDAALKNIITKEVTVTDVAQKVAMGEADAGIVYVTDAKPFLDKVKVIDIPDKYNVIATYPVAIVRGTKDKTLSKKFVDFILNGDGKKTLKDYGFIMEK